MLWPAFRFIGDKMLSMLSTICWQFAIKKVAEDEEEEAAVKN